MIEKIFKKDKYFDCFLIKHGIHFFHDNIRACCSNVEGPVFYQNYDGRDIDWDYIYNKRKQYVKEINSFFNKKEYPIECENCFEIPNLYKKNKIDDFPNVVNKIFIQNNMICNAKCVYCSFQNIEKSFKYRVLPIINSMINNGILSKNALVYMSGGEITISPEFEELFSTLYNYLNQRIEILTSGIKYSEAIKQAFTDDKVMLVISLDCADREIFNQIKRVDCFDNVVNNIKTYISASECARDNITLKYIIIDEMNDNKKSIHDFVHLVKDIGVNNIRLDIDYEKYKYKNDLIVPEHYFDLYEHFNSIAQDLGLNIKTNSQVKAILDKKRD